MKLNLSEWAVRNGALTLFLMLLVATAGGVSYLKLGRAEDPGFTLKLMVVSAQWPGATAEEMQAQVADRIESRLQDLPHLDHLQTFTRPGSAITTVVLRDTTPPREVQGLWYQARKKVGDMRHTLPAGVQGPFFDDEYSDVYAGLLALTGADNAELVRQAEQIRLRLLALPGAGKVAIFGEQAQQVFVDVSHARLATLAVPPSAILDALARHNAVAPAGVAETGSSRIFLRTDTALDGLAVIRAVPVESGGRSLRLGDIASISRGTADPPAAAIRHEGRPAVLVGVAKRPGVDVLALGRDLDAAIAELRAGLPVGLTLEKIADQPAVVQDSVAEFLLKFVAALGVVMLVSFASLGFRAGIIVGLSVPLTLAMVFVVMQAWGMELERITLGALILSLGLLVDDAIIAIEAMVVKLEEGWDRARAATFAWSSAAFPMLTGTLVTVAGFLPVGFAASTAGEYAGGIFWVVGAALVASWFVAVVFTPWLGVKLLPGRAERQHASYVSRMYRRLRRVVGWCVDHRVVVVLASLAVLAAGFAGMAATRKQIFSHLRPAGAAGRYHAPPGRRAARHPGSGRGGRGGAARRPGCAQLHHLSRLRQPALLPGAQPRPAERILRQGGDPERRPRRPRTAAGEAGGAGAGGCRAGGPGACLAAGIRPASRLPRAVPRAGAGCRYPAPGRRGCGRRPAGHAGHAGRAVLLGRAGAGAADRAG